MPSYFFLVWVILIGFMFYFMMIKPQKRARAQQVDLLQHIAPGAEVRTNAHILGTVTEVGDDWVIIETTPGTRLKIGKPAIVAIILPDEPEDEADETAVVEAHEDEPTAADAVQDKVADAAPAVQDAPAAAEAAVTAETAEPAENATKS
jgi:preprotein translocase subunit YajC